MVGHVLPLLLLALAAGPLAGQSVQDGASSGAARVVLQGNVHRAVQDQVAVGHADSSLPMRSMLLSFQMRPAAKVALEHLLVDLQDPGSPSYHQWLSPEQFAARFGPSAAERAKVVAWLQGQGFTIDHVARGGMSVQFSGDVGLVEQAFRTPIMEYRVQGQLRHANAADPSIPAELAPLVAGVVSMHNIPRKPMLTGVHKLTGQELAHWAGAGPLFNYRGSHFMSPADFATIYNVKPLYTAGIDGTGVRIAIAGRTHPVSAVTDWATFRSTMGLSDNPPVFLLNPTSTDPGDLSLNDPTDYAGEDSEADLDVEWAGAAAPGAAVTFVCSASTNSTDGIDLSAQYIVDEMTPHPSVLSVSFGSCESSMGATEQTFYHDLWARAASYGISVFVASGDAGAAGCNSGGDTVGSGRAVNGMGSTPSNVAVGGTMFQEGAGTYWSASNSAYDGSALGYIPEVVWNESASSGASGASDLWATGGGASNLYTKPTWQVARGVPSDGMRDVPDVALSAAGHDAYLVETVGDDGTDEGLYSISGTSVSSPAFAGLMALIVQSTGGVGLGNPDQEFYVMGNAQYAASPGTTIFHPITSGNNSVPGTTGFSASSTPGYNQATGLGSVDANALVTNWPGAGTIAIATPYASVGLLTGTTATFTATVTGTGNTGVTWSTTGDASISAAGLFKPNAAGSYTVTAAAAAAPSTTVTISVNVHGANLSSTDSGTAVTGMDVLTLLGSYATSNSALELAGGGVIDSADLSILLTKLGW